MDIKKLCILPYHEIMSQNSRSNCNWSRFVTFAPAVDFITPRESESSFA